MFSVKLMINEGYTSRQIIEISGAGDNTMKQILQNLSNRETSLVEVPCPKNIKSNILNVC
jgi:hypothetical protein